MTQLQFVRLDNSTFQNTKSLRISNLPTLQSIEIGSSCFKDASAFSLIGIANWMQWDIELPKLESVTLGENAFQNTKSFSMSKLTSLRCIELGQNCFKDAPSFSLVGATERLKWRLDLSQLKSIILGAKALHNTVSFEMTNLPSLQFLDFGDECFNGEYRWVSGMYSSYFRHYGGVKRFSLRDIK